MTQPFFNLLFFAMLVGIGGGTFLAAAFTNPLRARELLGSRAADFANLPDEILQSAMRATIWSVDGLALVVLTALYFRSTFYVASYVAGLFDDRMWVGVMVAAPLGALIPTLMATWRRRTLAWRLERRLATP